MADSEDAHVAPTSSVKPRISYACEACRVAKVKCQPGNAEGICRRYDSEPKTVCCNGGSADKPDRCGVSKRECVFKLGPRTRRRRSKLYVFSQISISLSKIESSHSGKITNMTDIPQQLVAHLPLQLHQRPLPLMSPYKLRKVSTRTPPYLSRLCERHTRKCFATSSTQMNFLVKGSISQ